MGRGKAIAWWLGSVLALVLLAGCATKAPTPPPSAPRAEPPAGAPPSRKVPGTQRPYTIQGKTYHPLPTAEGYREGGIASWYGPNFHGKRTSNGERYDMEAMTAAHKTLPMDTWVDVRNLENGRTLTLRINDRGPFVDGRVIDLSKAAARDLGVLGRGTAPVEVTALGFKRLGTGVPGRPVEYVQPASYEVGTFTVQVGAFVDPTRAQRLAKELRPQWGQVFVVRYDRGDQVFHRVRVGKVERLEQAKELQAKLRAAGQTQAFAVGW